MKKQTSLPEGGKWVVAPCPHNCGGKCLLKAYIREGEILQMRTDDSPEDEVNRQQRACLRGLCQQHQVRGKDRLLYPMKRTHWQPGNPNGHLRGRDTWERISWDEAAAYIAGEIARIRESGADNAVLCAWAGMDLLNKLDMNYLTAWGTTSWGGWFNSAVLGWAEGSQFADCNNDRLDLLSCRYVVAFGYNPASSALGNAVHYARMWKERGAQFILFDPVYTQTAEMLGARWIPIRPGTDMAAMIAMAYVMLTEDKQRGLIDWDFLNRCCLGHDAAHMPDDAADGESFFDYLLGKADGIPKTPQWAENICGVPADTLREVARILGKDNQVALLSSFASARGYGAEQLPQMTIALGALGGHIGKSGHTTGPTGWNQTNNFGPRLILAGDGGPTGEITGSGRRTWVAEAQQWDAVLGKPFNPTALFKTINLAGPEGWEEAVRGIDYKKRPEPVTASVKMIWNGRTSRLTCSEGVKKGIEAHRAVDFVLGQGHFMTATNRYSDIVLPITTAWEEEACGYQWKDGSEREVMFVSDKVLEPMGEAVSDREAMIRIGEKLGLPRAAWGNVPAKQRLFNAVADTKVICEDGRTWENLCAITQEDIARWGVKGQPQAGRIPIDQYMADGMYRVDRREGDNYGFIHKQAFREDPEKNPISTPSGKIEIYCQTYADMVNNHGFGGAPLHGLPKYRPGVQGYEKTLSGDYPLQCISIHTPRRAHSIFHNIAWLDEALGDRMLMAKADAAARGIADGDTVKVSSPHGDTLIAVSVSARMTPGVVAMPHGRWCRVDEETGIDHGGSANYITGAVQDGIGMNGYNTLCVQVEKWAAARPRI